MNYQYKFIILRPLQKFIINSLIFLIFTLESIAILSTMSNKIKALSSAKSDSFSEDTQLKKSDTFMLNTHEISSCEFDRTSSSVRFLRQSLIESLHVYKKQMKAVPIEKFEVDLFLATRTYHSKMNGKKITFKCMQQIHHIQKLSEGNILIDPFHERILKERIDLIIVSNPLITIEYNLLITLFELFNGLLAKWGIANFNNYDYRYTGRCLNVKLLDLNAINLRFMSLDILWISTKIFTPPLDVLSTPALVEIAHILHYQLAKCCEVFLALNPKIINPDYDIERALAFSSAKYHDFSKEVLPEQNLTNFKHAELSVAKGFMKCFKTTNPKTKYAYKALAELELGFRSFEKHLISNLLKASASNEFS